MALNTGVQDAHDVDVQYPNVERFTLCEHMFVVQNGWQSHTLYLLFVVSFSLNNYS